MESPSKILTMRAPASDWTGLARTLEQRFGKRVTAAYTHNRFATGNHTSRKCSNTPTIILGHGSAGNDAAVDDVIALVGTVDGILQAQSAADTHYFVEVCGRPLTAVEVEAVKATVLAAYRYQYIASGVQIPRFGELLNGMITPAQGQRIGAALAPIMA
jgi:hypothetical protein